MSAILYTGSGDKQPAACHPLHPSMKLAAVVTVLNPIVEMCASSITLLFAFNEFRSWKERQQSSAARRSNTRRAEHVAHAHRVGLVTTEAIVTGRVEERIPLLIGLHG